MRQIRNEHEHHAGRTTRHSPPPLASNTARPPPRPGQRPARNHDHVRCARAGPSNEPEHHVRGWSPPRRT